MRVFLFIVIAALLALTIYLWRNKNTQEACDCSAAIDEGYDMGVVDGMNALEDEPAIETFDNETSTAMCPQGFYHNGKECIRLLSSSMGSSLGSSVGSSLGTSMGPSKIPTGSKPTCPPGEVFVNGKCTLFFKPGRKPTCPPGEVFVNGKCKKFFNPGSESTSSPYLRGKKYQEKTGSKFVRPSGGVCPAQTQMVPSGKWGGWCQRSGDWYKKYRGKDSKSGKLFTCTGGRVAFGDTCICGDGKIWKNGKCVCDSSRGLKWNNSQKRCTPGGSGGSSGGGKSSSSGGSSSSSGCKPGQIRRASDNKCVCAPGTKWDGSKCSGGSSGGGKSSSSGGSSSSSGCKPGQIRRASDNKCVCAPGTKWDGSKCA